MAHGFVYLTAVVDVAGRKVLAHRVAITLEARHAKEVIELVSVTPRRSSSWSASTILTARRQLFWPGDFVVVSGKRAFSPAVMSPFWAARRR